MTSKILRLRDVVQVTGLSRSTIYAEIAKGKFPRQVSLTGRRSVGWPEHAVTQWVESRQTNATPIQHH